jgi:hypothetical protein
MSKSRGRWFIEAVHVIGENTGKEGIMRSRGGGVDGEELDLEAELVCPELRFECTPLEEEVS